MFKRSAMFIGLVCLLQSGGLSFFACWLQAARLPGMQAGTSAGTATLVLSRTVYQRSLVRAGEIRYRGRLYDIRAMRVQHGQVVLHVERDALEEAVLALLFTESGAGMTPAGQTAPVQWHHPDFAGSLLACAFPVPGRRPGMTLPTGTLPHRWQRVPTPPPR